VEHELFFICETNISLVDTMSLKFKDEDLEAIQDLSESDEALVRGLPPTSSAIPAVERTPYMRDDMPMLSDSSSSSDSEKEDEADEDEDDEEDKNDEDEDEKEDEMEAKDEEESSSESSEVSSEEEEEENADDNARKPRKKNKKKGKKPHTENARGMAPKKNVGVQTQVIQQKVSTTTKSQNAPIVTGIQKISHEPAIDENGWEKTTYRINFRGSPKDLDSFAEEHPTGMVTLNLKNEGILVDAASKDMKKRVKLNKHGVIDVEPTTTTTTTSKQPKSAGGKGQQPQQAVPQTPKIIQGDIVRRVTMIEPSENQWGHDLEYKIPNLSITGHHSLHMPSEELALSTANKDGTKTGGLSFILRSGEVIKQPRELASTDIDKAMVNYHKNYPHYGSVDSWTDNVYHNVGNTVLIEHTPDKQHPVVDFAFLQKEKAGAYDAYTKQQQELAEQQKQAVSSGHYDKNGHYHGHSWSIGGSYGHKPGHHGKKGKKGKKGANAMSSANKSATPQPPPPKPVLKLKKEIVISKDNPGYYIMDAKDYRNTVKVMKQQDPIVKKVTSLSNVADPTIHIAPIETKGDIKTILRRKAANNAAQSAPSVFEISENGGQSKNAGSSASKKPSAAVVASATTGTKSGRALLNFATTDVNEKNSSSAGHHNNGSNNSTSSGSPNNHNRSWKAHSDAKEIETSKDSFVTLVIESIPSSRLRELNN
jgi:hypothetical protein